MMKRLFIIVMFGLSLNLFGLALEEWKWGFDGTIVEHRINPFSAMISNPMPAAFDGMVTLQRISFMGRPVGAPLIKKVFLGPYGTKLIQFYPYIRNSDEEWQISWGRGAKQQARVNTPSAKGRAVVYLTADTPLLTQRRIRLSSFPENLFPPFVSATDGLLAVVIDKIPEFTPLQRQAFRDWLFGGGKVHIVATDGKTPDFGSDYSYLNILGNRADVGSGEVILHFETSTISLSTLGAPQKITSEEDNIYIQDSEDSYFRKLRSQLKTNHNWVLIFLISILYGLLVTVVNFIIGRRSKTALKPILFFVTTVLIFSFLLAWCGRRGYGEKTHILALSYAKELEPGHFDVAQWMDVFVTTGDYYKISHKDKNSIYSDCQTENTLNAEIYNGRDGAFFVDIPLFSSMQLFHRMVADTKQPLKVDVAYRTNGDMTNISINLGDKFPKSILKVIAIFNGKIYKLKMAGAWNKYSNKFTEDSVETVSKYIRDWSSDGGFYGFYSSNDNQEEVFESMIAPLIIRSRGGDQSIEDYYPTASADDNKVDIFILTATPQEFKTNSDVIKEEDGFTLFHFIRPVK